MISTPNNILVIDACVMMSGLQRRLLLSLAADNVFQPAWSERIGDEWKRNAGRVWDIPAQNLQEEWEFMQSTFPFSMAHAVDAYKKGLRYSDPKDWHVIAAALEMRDRHPNSQIEILTLNLKDFNRSELRRLGLSALTPDRKLAALWPKHQARICTFLSELAAEEPPAGLPYLSIDARLGRERMFVLRKLLTGSAPTIENTL